VKKKDITRNQLIKTSARLFNSQGYKSTSLSEITAATGLSKGAIYSHFGSKENLEQEAFQYMIKGFMSQMSTMIKAETDTRAKMLVILDYFAGYAVNPPFYGGCPMVNASVELDDSDAQLKEIVTQSTEVFYNSIRHILDNGKKYGQVNADADTRAYASLMFSATEGAIVIMKITGVRRHLRDVVAYLKLELDRILI